MIGLKSAVIAASCITLLPWLCSATPASAQAGGDAVEESIKSSMSQTTSGPETAPGKTDETEPAAHAILSKPAAGNQVPESNMPSPKYDDKLNPELAAKYTYQTDGEYTTVSGLPTYEWLPAAVPPRAILIGIHGLSLHGRRYRVLARLLAINAVGFVSMDMRGFGRCAADPERKFSTSADDKTKVDHEKSYQNIVEIVKLAKQKYPGKKVILIAESLGCTFAVRMAGEHKDLVDGIILSAPAVKLNRDMYIGHGNLARGVKSVFTPSHLINLHHFVTSLVSPSPEVVNEMLDDPLISKALPLGSLLSTDLFVGKTAKWGKNVGEHLPVLIIQGSNDGCVSPTDVIELTNNMPSDDQTLAWRGNYGHLQLESIFIRPSILNALVNWLYDHSIDTQAKLKTVQATIGELGGRLRN